MPLLESFSVVEEWIPACAGMGSGKIADCIFKPNSFTGSQDEEFFLTPSTAYPHAEERRGAAGARLEARTAPDAAHSCPASARRRLRENGSGPPKPRGPPLDAAWASAS